MSDDERDVRDLVRRAHAADPGDNVPDLDESLADIEQRAAEQGSLGPAAGHPYRPERQEPLRGRVDERAD